MFLKKFSIKKKNLFLFKKKTKMNSSVTNNKILQSDYGLLVVFTPITTSSNGFYINKKPHLVCSACYVNVQKLLDNITKKSQQIKNEKAGYVSSIFSKIKSLEIPDLENVKNVENKVIKLVLNETVQEKPDFFMFYVNFVSPSLNLNNFNYPSSGIHFIPIPAYSFISKFISPLFVNLNNSSDIIDHQFSKSDINKFIFFFRGINWPILQKTFRKNGIEISGGIGTKRAFLSTSNYFLSKFLFYINFSSTDIYNYYNQTKDFESFNSDEIFEDDDIYFMKYVLINLNHSDMIGYLKRKVELESQISNDKSTLKSTITRYANFQGVSATKKIKNDNKINRMKQELQDLSNELSKIESEIVKIQEEDKLLQSKNLTLENVVPLYNKRFIEKHINNFVLGIKDNLKQNRKFNQNSAFSAISNKRSYSTIIKRENSQSFENSNLMKKKIEILPNNILSEFKELFDNDPIFTLIKITMLSDLSIYEKQGGARDRKKISEFWEYRFFKEFSSGNNLFLQKYGIDLLIKNLENTKRHLDDFLNNKSLMKNKWYKNYILSINSKILIFIVISNLIPFGVKYMSSKDKNPITIFEKIGNSIIENVLKSEWFKYINEDDYKLKLLYDKKEFNINKGLTYEEFVTEYSKIFADEARMIHTINRENLIRFNRIGIPLMVLTYLTIWNNLNFNNIFNISSYNSCILINISESDITNKFYLPFLGTGFKFKNKFVLIPLILLLTRFIVLPIFSSQFPSFYLYISTNMFNICIVLMFLWVLCLCLYYIFELFIFNLYLINDKLKLPNWLLFILKYWSPNLKNKSKSSLKDIYKQNYLKILIFHLIILIIIFLIMIYFVIL